ncbi:MAG: AzlD family protein [Litorivicinus sp.]
MTTQVMILGVAVMTLATVLTRILGVWAMRFVPLTPRVKRFLTGMANTVLVALVAPYAWEGDWAMRLGLVGAVAIMAATRKTVLAMILGVLMTALVRVLLPL